MNIIDTKIIDIEDLFVILFNSIIDFKSNFKGKISHFNVVNKLDIYNYNIDEIDKQIVQIIYVVFKDN